jgi:site-specific recombinase XerD
VSEAATSDPPARSQASPGARATPRRPRRRAGTGLTGRWAEVLSGYRAALDRADLSDHARRGYAARVAGFLEWLAAGVDLDLDGAGDPLGDPHARDFAIRDYRSHLKTVRKAQPSTINAALTALDHFYGAHLGLGRPVARRERLPQTAPEALDEAEQRRFLRAAQRCGSARNAAIGLLLLYTGLRVEEAEALDVDDVPISVRRGKVIVRAGKGTDGGYYREVPLHRKARTALRTWLDERPTHPGAETTPALFVSRLGDRLGARSIRAVIADIGVTAGLVHDHGPRAGASRVHPHTLRHTFATQLLRRGVDIVVVADLLGHARLDTTRTYTRSSEADRAHAIDTALITDE